MSAGSSGSSLFLPDDRLFQSQGIIGQFKVTGAAGTPRRSSKARLPRSPLMLDLGLIHISLERSASLDVVGFFIWRAVTIVPAGSGVCQQDCGQPQDRKNL